MNGWTTIQGTQYCMCCPFITGLISVETDGKHHKVKEKKKEHRNFRESMSTSIMSVGLERDFEI